MSNGNCACGAPLDYGKVRRCRECDRAYQTAWRKANPDKVGNHARKRLYGVSVGQYEQMLADQGGGCAICGEQCTFGRKLAVDHDHSCCSGSRKTCGKCVRGLLCSRCNRVLGQMNDDPSLLEAAAAYLGRYAV